MEKQYWDTDNPNINFSDIVQIEYDFDIELEELLARKIFFNSNQEMKQRFHDSCYDIIARQIFDSKGWRDILNYIHDESLSFGLNSIVLEKDDNGSPIVSSQFIMKADSWDFAVCDNLWLGPYVEHQDDIETILELDSSDYYYLYFRIWHLYKLQDYIFHDKKIEPITNTFESLFKEQMNASKLKKALRDQKYINEENKWKGKSGSQTELLALFLELQEAQIIRRVKPTTGARIFYKEFGLPVGKVKDGNYINERSFTNPPNRNDSLDFSHFVINLYDLE